MKNKIDKKQLKKIETKFRELLSYRYLPFSDNQEPVVYCRRISGLITLLEEYLSYISVADDLDEIDCYTKQAIRSSMAKTTLQYIKKLINDEAKTASSDE